MEREATLSDYIAVVVRKWKWILGIAFSTMLAALVISLVIPPTYVAVAVIISSPVPLSVNPVGLMQSPAVAAQVLKNLGPVAANENSATLAKKIRITIEPQDKYLYRVFAQDETPQKAVELANVWAQVAADQFTRTYITTSMDLRDRYAQLAMARVQQTDEALAKFVQSNGLTMNDVASFATIWGLSAQRPINGDMSRISNLSAPQGTELADLLRRRDVANSVYTSYAVQAAQIKFEVEAQKQGAEISQSASVQATSAQSNLKANLGVGGVVGVILGLVAAFTVEYLESSGKAHPKVSGT